MKLGISIKIDVTKIEKARMIKGDKGTYIDLTTWIDTDNQDQYGNNGFISQSVTKEEREQNIKTPILGNVKVFYSNSRNEPQAQSAPQRRPQPAPPHNDDFEDMDIPF